MPRRQVSEAGLKLLMGFEGYRRSAARLADGRWTIGYGHTRSAREGISISEADARALLAYDLMEIADALGRLVFSPLTQNQFDALACLAFNVGLDSFRQSAVLRLVNEGALVEAAFALEHWRRAQLDGEEIVVDGLVRRRAAEKALFLTPPEGFIAVPTPVLRARLDQEHQTSSFSSRPVEVRASLTGDIARAERVREVGPVFPPLPDEIEPFPEAVEDEIGAGFTPIRVTLPEPPPKPPVIAPQQQAAQPETARQPLKARFGDFEFETAEPEQAGYGPWVGLGLFGLAVFAVALFWALSARGPSGPFSPQVIGTLAALAGVACVVCSVYALIQRYLERDD